MGCELRSTVKIETNKQEAKMDTEREENIWTKQYKLKRKPREKKNCTQGEENECFPHAAFMFSHRCSHQKCVYLWWNFY